MKEETTGQARAEEQLSNEQAEAYRRQMGDKFCAMVVRSFLYNSLLRGKNGLFHLEIQKLEPPCTGK